MMAIEQSKRAGDLINESPNKKRRVEFEDSHDFSASLYKNFVSSALDDLERNESLQAETLAAQVSNGELSPENMQILLQTLSHNIHKLDSAMGQPLVTALVNLSKWWTLPAKVTESYVLFLRVLCSSLPKWWQDVSLSLVQSFTLPSDAMQMHHELLKYGLAAIPSSTQYISKHLASNFPNKQESKKHLVNYLTNTLALCEYCSELKFQLWGLIIEKIISMDVELQNELDEMDDEVEEGQSDMDESEDESESEDEEIEEDEMDIIEGEEEYIVEVTQNIKQLSSKLDAMMLIVSSSLESSFTEEKLDNGEGVAMFNTLISLFKSHILPTYYTKSIQYLMFHVAQQQPELMDAFLVTLIDIAFSPQETMEKRIKSLQYIGSFIARAKKLTRAQIVFVVSYLTSWLKKYVLEREIEVDEGSMERFKHFYAVFQALCYIFCFRHALLKAEVGVWECELDKFFQRIIVSKFNPLKYCNENVMAMFARIAQHEGLAYCFSIIQKNNSERLRGITGTGNKAGGNFSMVARQQFIDLESYFPYDPLILKNYKDFMADYYVEWSDVSGDIESDDSSDEFDDMEITRQEIGAAL